MFKYLYRLFRFITNIPITGKIVVGFSIFLSIMLVFALLFYRNIRQEQSNLNSISNISLSTANLLDINREISEVQRLANVYGTTGSETVINKMMAIFPELEKKLLLVERSTKDDARVEQVRTLKSLIAQYQESVKSLQDHYIYREKLLKVEMPKIKAKSNAFLQDRIISAQSLGLLRETIFFHSILQKLNRMSESGIDFLDQKKFNHKEDFFKVAEEIRKETQNSPWFSSTEKSLLIQLLDQNRHIFEKSVLANRNYFSLVNVVMAGSALEFKTISDSLRESSLQDLSAHLESSNQLFVLNKKILILFFIGTLPILFLLGLYYQVNIANSLKQISKTFERFIEGDIDNQIVGVERHDEIGQLARAADKFRELMKRVKREEFKSRRSTEAKSRFLANMSHEIRTPMNGVLACAELLLSEEQSPDHRKLLETIRLSGDSLLLIIDDILDFSKVESGMIEINRSEVNLRDVVNEVNTLLSVHASSNDVSLFTDIRDEVPALIMADPQRLRQILINLVGNGIKFCEGKVEVKVEAKTKGDGAYEIQVSVADDGIGISKAGQKLLFKDFSQLDTSSTRRYGGTGLGLAISKGIVHAMGGEIWVNSQAGGGSVFSFAFDAQEVEKTDKLPETSLRVSQVAPSDSLTILLVEDNQINKMVGRRILEKLGYRVDIASNGIEALRAVEAKTYQLIFMDQHMPEMDGLEATRCIRAMENINQPMICALTASAFEEDKQRCFEAGMNDFLTKPLTALNLQIAIQKNLEAAGDRNKAA